MRARNKILIGVMTLLMVGCSSEQETPVAIVVGKPCVGDVIREWQYEGHSYILFRNCIIHSESCKCKKVKNEMSV